MADLLRPLDMAQIAGVRPNDIAHWKLRYGDFPEPAGKVGGVVAYDRDKALAWLRTVAARRVAKAKTAVSKAEAAMATAHANLAAAQELNDRLN